MGTLSSEQSPKIVVDYFKERVGGVPRMVNNRPSGECLWHGMLNERQRRNLGGDFHAAFDGCGGTVGLLQQARGTSRDRSILDAAWHLNLINRSDFLRLDAIIRQREPAPQVVVEGPDIDASLPIEDQIEEARARRSLVICEGIGTRVAYWRGNLIEVNWNRKTAVWNFFQALIAAARKNTGIDHWTMRRTHSCMSTTRHRLKQLLPPELDDLIVFTEPSSYSLNVQPKEIVVFELGMEDHPFDDSNLKMDMSLLLPKEKSAE